MVELSPTGILTRRPEALAWAPGIGQISTPCTYRYCQSQSSIKVLKLPTKFWILSSQRPFVEHKRPPGNISQREIPRNIVFMLRTMSISIMLSGLPVNCLPLIRIIIKIIKYFHILHPSYIHPFLPICMLSNN